MPPQRRSVALQRPSPLQKEVHRDRQHPTQRVEGIINSIYAEMSRMQHNYILMLQNRDNMLRAYANDRRAYANENASLEEQNRSLLEHVKSLQRENCSLELKHNQQMSEWAKERLQCPEKPDGKRPEGPV
ncbi:hypothetical protein E8E15_000517 [Penicillium rubens]|uniref:Uncharacterized protein n=1 Tax=Penicillium chrysogenum TaxID=5076 RepID=A0A167X2I5_PENCH|nr:uncharacterized protein N7525_002832 [Penicillium rubens]KAF3000050.1 hypothetical protein E8E15_000517 [Penicillium rubens]KAJ5837644.1 hypothetical protein N7525_002832 [Penicillium rubens]KZN92335.1 hypothetical protein EN45_024890 [Penicillium chrysogenum]